MTRTILETQWNIKDFLLERVKNNTFDDVIDTKYESELIYEKINLSEAFPTEKTSNKFDLFMQKIHIKWYEEKLRFSTSYNSLVEAQIAWDTDRKNRFSRASLN